jgi:hypothetical protein
LNGMSMSGHFHRQKIQMHTGYPAPLSAPC